jgi:tetratricopeptide (TPR) repeat protein
VRTRRLLAWSRAVLALGVLTRISPVTAAELAPAVVGDLAFGEVLFHFYQEDYFSALTRLLAARERGELTANAGEAEILLGGLYLSYGQHRQAGSIFERVLAQSVEPALHDRAWYFLARIWYQRGYLPEAEAALARIANELPPELEPQRQMLHAQVLMEQGQFEAALQRLRSWEDPQARWLAYAKYNAGVALVRLDRVDAGSVVLAEVGMLEAEDSADESVAALRDKANVALGYAWLQAGQPAAAKPALQRVRLSGPYSNKALLGVGWADAAEGRYSAALAPWAELHGRSVTDTAVQESLLAVPYAFAQLGASQQAATHYEDAIAAFELEMQRLDESIRAIRGGNALDRWLDESSAGKSGWYWQLDQIPASTDTRQLYELMATHRFQEALKNYRDLRQMRANLAQWADSVAVFEDILDTRQRAYTQRQPVVQEQLERTDVTSLSGRHLGLETALAEIELREDVAALGTPREQALWRELVALEHDLARLGSDVQAEELRAKQKFLKGLLLWDLRRDYSARLWKAKRNVQDLERQLERAVQHYHRVDKAQADWPQKFKELSSRIDGVTPRVANLAQGLDQALVGQREFVQHVAVEALEMQRERLAAYAVQARFALASLYDRAGASATLSSAGTTGATP